MRGLSSSSSTSYRRPANTRWRPPSSANCPTSPPRRLGGVTSARWSATGGRRLRMSTAAPSAAAAVAAAEVVQEELPTNEGSPELLRIRHTSAHVMAMAVQKLFPGTQVTIGPWIDNG